MCAADLGAGLFCAVGSAGSAFGGFCECCDCRTLIWTYNGDPLVGNAGACEIIHK